MTRRGDEVRGRILEVIPQLRSELGYDPTLAQITVRVGLARASTYKHLSRLRAEGRVELPRRFSGWRIPS